MKDFEIRALDRQTGRPATLRFQAESEEDAIRQAGQRGYVVEGVEEVPTLDYASPMSIEQILASMPQRVLDAEPGKFRVVMFQPTFDPDGPQGTNPAEQLEHLINKEASKGWIFSRLETVEPWQAAPSGEPVSSQCNKTVYLAVFRSD